MIRFWRFWHFTVLASISFLGTLFAALLFAKLVGLRPADSEVAQLSRAWRIEPAYAIDGGALVTLTADPPLYDRTLLRNVTCAVVDGAYDLAPGAIETAPPASLKH